jgi:hypothetical protein
MLERWPASGSPPPGGHAPVFKRLVAIAAALVVALSAAISAAVLLLAGETLTLNAQDDRAVARAAGSLEQNTRHAAGDAAADRAFVEELGGLVALQRQARGFEKQT